MDSVLMGSVVLEVVMRLVRGAHVLAGAIGLALFWVPVLSRKGGATHRQFGGLFLICAKVIGWTGLASVALHLLRLIGSGRDPLAHPLFGFLVFLGYLACNVLVSAWYMRHVLINKQDLAGLRRPLAKGLAVLSLLASLLVVGIALVAGGKAQMLLLALSPLGVLNAWGISRHLRRPDREPRAWFFEHMGHGIGLGIAFHTAFLVFGAREMLGQWLQGGWGVAVWILPVVIGVSINRLLESRYRQRFLSLAAH